MTLLTSTSISIMIVSNSLLLLISFCDGYTDKFISTSSNEFNGQKISCSGNGDCKIICSESHSCFNAQIECPLHFQCDITCSGRNSCQSSFIQCPFGELCSVDCTNSNSCRQMTIDGKYASELHLNDCSSGDLSCNGMTIYFPPNTNGKPRGFIHGGNTLASLNNEPLHFYAIFGWYDIDIMNYNGNYKYNINGLMHCLPHYTSTCHLSIDSWSCLHSNDICNSPPTQQPTNAPTSSPTANPTYNPTIDPSPYPTYSPTLQPTTSMVTVPAVFLGGYDPAAPNYNNNNHAAAAQSGVLWILISILLSILCFIMIILTYYVYISRYKNDEGDIRGMAVNRYRAALSISNLKHQPSHEQSGHNLLPNQNIDDSDDSDQDIDHNLADIDDAPPAMMHDDNDCNGDDDQVLIDGFGIDTDFGLSDNEEGKFINDTNRGNIANKNNDNNNNSHHLKAKNSIQVTENPLALKLQQHQQQQQQQQQQEKEKEEEQGQFQFVSYSNNSQQGNAIYAHIHDDRLASSMPVPYLQGHAKPENAVNFHHDHNNSYTTMSNSPFTYFVKQDGIRYGITQPQSDVNINIMAYNQQLQNTNTLPPENILYHHLQQLQPHNTPLCNVDDDVDDDDTERKDCNVEDITVSAMSDVEDDGETKPISSDKPESTKNSPSKRNQQQKQQKIDFISVNTNNLSTPKETSCKSTKAKLSKKHRFSVSNNLSILSPLSTVTASSVTTTKYGGTATTKYQETGDDSPPIYHDEEDDDDNNMDLRGSEVPTENVDIDKQRHLAFGSHDRFGTSQGFTLTLSEDKNSDNRTPSVMHSSSSSADNSSSSSSAASCSSSADHSSSSSCSSTDDDDLTRITSDDSDDSNDYEDDDELKRSEIDDSCTTTLSDDASSSDTNSNTNSDDIDEKLKEWNNDLSQDVDKYDSDSLDSFERKRKMGQSTVSDTTQYHDNPMYHNRYTTTLIKDAMGNPVNAISLNTPSLKPINHSSSRGLGLMNIKISDDSQLYESPYDDHSRNDSNEQSKGRFKYIVSEYDGNKSMSLTPETPMGHTHTRTANGHTSSVGTQILKQLLFTVGRGSNTTTSHVKSPVDDEDDEEEDLENNDHDNNDVDNNNNVGIGVGVTSMQHGHTNSTLEIQGLINV